jgi:hypothetical protein
MQSQRSIEIQRLRSIALNETEAPIERLVAARRLLSKYGPTERNVPVVRKVVKVFDHDADAEVAERCLKLKAQLLKRLDLQEVASVPIDDDGDDQAIADAEPSTSPAATETQREADFASTVLAPDVEFVYPPRDAIFPPPTAIYKLGDIDFTNLAARLRGLPLPSLTGHDANEAVIRAALGLSAFVPIELPLLQKVFLALFYEPKAIDRSRSANDSSRFWPYAMLFAGVFNLATAKYGYGSLHDPPPDPRYVRELIQQARQSAYVRLEQLPRAIEAAKHYRHLPVFEDLLREIQGAQQ